MNQDTNPTLTEDDLDIMWRCCWNFYSNYSTNAQRDYFDKLNSALDKFKPKEILTALDQYPKLKDRLDNALQMISTKEGEVIKLKAENEELKKHKTWSESLIQGWAQKYDKLHQENNQLKQLKEKLQKHLENDFVWMDNKSLRSELQQLLKDDTT